MFSLSKESEQELSQGVLELVNKYLEAHSKVIPRQLGLMSAKQVREELGLQDTTLKRWELEGGLKKYQPPLEDSRKVYYKVSDILIFLGANK